MVFLKRRRLLVWLIKAYLKKWGKSFLISFVLGLALFIVLFLNRNFFLSKIPINKNEAIGIAGIYSKQGLPNTLPDIVLNKASAGLTKISSTGQVLPDVAQKWEIKDDGKTFIFYLKPNIYFSDGKILDSSSINFNFEDVTVERPARNVIVFKLKDKYSPFLVTLANRKIFKNNYIGVSDYKISKIKTNGGFVDYIELYSKKDKTSVKYDFYDTQEALKNAYVLGEVTTALGINDPEYLRGVNLTTFKNTNATKDVTYEKIVTLFFNNQDPLLSDKKVRKALTYSLPEGFKEGNRAKTMYPQDSWAYSGSEAGQYDVEYAKLLLEQSDASTSGTIKIQLKTLPQYEKVAHQIADYWKKIKIDTKIEVVYGVPTFYQVFLGELPVLKDPDQYTLWHTGQASNITNYKNLRIDKLLEDGRRTYNINERKKIYSDFQKYLLDDAPASFLYFPYSYSLVRK